MRLKLYLKCKENCASDLNLQRKNSLFEGLRPNIKAKDINYIAFILKLEEKDFTYCEAVVAFDSKYSVENYKNIFAIGRKVSIFEGRKVLAKCIIKDYEEFNPDYALKTPYLY